MGKAKSMWSAVSSEKLWKLLLTPAGEKLRVLAEASENVSGTEAVTTGRQKELHCKEWTSTHFTLRTSADFGIFILFGDVFV